MEEALTHVEFRSDRFGPAESDDRARAGPSARRLAEFLRDGLRAQQVETDLPVAEDWGWLIPVKHDHFRIWIGCGRYAEYPDGFLCFIEARAPLVWRLMRRVDPRDAAAALQQAIDSVLTEAAGVREKRWWTGRQFNDVRP